MVRGKAIMSKIPTPKGRTMSRRHTKKRKTNLSADVTLPDGNFLDSFDKFIAAEKK